MPSRSPELDAMIRAATLAAEGLAAAASRPDLLVVREKGASDFVSNADLRSQDTIRAELSRACPDHGFLLEEGAEEESAVGARFIVDPLDGTTNFVHAIPHFAVSIAREVAGVVVAGTVVDVMRREVFWAERGKGAWLGDRRLAVSRERELSRAVIGTGIPHHGGAEPARYLDALGRVMADVAGIRRLGAAALDLAYVAAGRFEAFFERGLARWDVAAGALLVREAGGTVTRIDGAPHRLHGDILATAGDSLHRAMLDRIAALHATSSAAPSAGG
jgi:myo-inositol-1(or 4)-monophosphatase